MNPCVVCSRACSKLCGGCGKVSYCSSAHQKQDWRNHRKECNFEKINDLKFNSEHQIPEPKDLIYHLAENLFEASIWNFEKILKQETILQFFGSSHLSRVTMDGVTTYREVIFGVYQELCREYKEEPNESLVKENLCVLLANHSRAGTLAQFVEEWYQSNEASQTNSYYQLWKSFNIPLGRK